MLAATKEENLSAGGDPRVLFPSCPEDRRVAAGERVGENSRLGFARKTVAPHQGGARANFQTALRDKPSVAVNTCRMSLLPQAQAQQNACTQPVLNAVNNQFGDNFTPADVGTGKFAPFPYPRVPGGTINIDIFVPPQDQPDGVSPGRYPINWWTYLIGYGPTLHIPSGPGGLDSPSTLIFSNSQFTAHIDSAFPYNPFGLLIHFLKDVLGIGGHSPCP